MYVIRRNRCVRSFDLRSPLEVGTLSGQRVRGRESRVRRNSPNGYLSVMLDLEEALGCEVDVVTEAGLSPYLRERILAEARPL